MKETVTLLIEKPKMRLRWAPRTKVRPGKRKDDRRGAGKWRDNG